MCILMVSRYSDKILKAFGHLVTLINLCTLFMHARLQACVNTLEYTGEYKCRLGFMTYQPL